MTDLHQECEHGLDVDQQGLTLPDWLYRGLHCDTIGRQMYLDQDWGLPIRSFEAHL